MSVTTTADEARRKASELLLQAYDELMVVLNRNTWGHNDLTDEYLKKLHTFAADIKTKAAEI